MSLWRQQAAHAALEWVGDHRVLGIGTGRTTQCFIDELVSIRSRIDACVASSCATQAYLRARGFTVLDLNVVESIPLYIDGADEVNAVRQMIKGGGGAMTREKIIASVAECFVCIVDETKYVEHLGNFPIALEVIPMARSFVAREVVKWGGNPIYRSGVLTDNGNCILDVHHLPIADTLALEIQLNQLTGVVDNGLFAARTADRVCMAGPQGGVRMF